MKNLLLICILVFASYIGIAQQVPEKSNAIISTQADSIGLKEKVLKVLADKEYTISSGKSSATVNTAAKTLKNGTRVAYIISFKGKDIILTGNLPVAGQASTRISYQGKKGTPIMNGWEEMEKIAKLLGGTVKYETR